MFYSSYSNSIQLYERQNGPQARLTGSNLVNFFRQPQGSSTDILELFKDAAKNPVKTKSKIESLSQNKIYVDISELGWGNEVIVKYKPRFTESDKMKEGGDVNSRFSSCEKWWDSLSTDQRKKTIEDNDLQFATTNDFNGLTTRGESELKTVFNTINKPKMKEGGGVNSKVKYSVNFKKRKSLGNYDRELEISESNKTLNQIYNLLYNIEYKDNGWYISGNIYIEDTNGLSIRIPEFLSNLDLEKMFTEKRNTSIMKDGGGLSNRASNETLLNSVIKGESKNIQGIKMSKPMAEAFLNWLKYSPFGIKYKKLSFNKLFKASFSWGLNRYINASLKDEYNKLKEESTKFIEGGKLTALIEDMKEFDKNIYPENSDISYKNRLIIAHFKTKGYSIIEIAKALKIIRN